MEDYTKSILKTDYAYKDFKDFEEFRENKVEEYTHVDTDGLLKEKQRFQVYQYYNENKDVMSLSRDSISIMTSLVSIFAIVITLCDDVAIKKFLSIPVAILALLTAVFWIWSLFDRRQENKRIQTCIQYKIAIQCIDTILAERMHGEEGNEHISAFNEKDDVRQFVVTLKEKK